MISTSILLWMVGELAGLLTPPLCRKSLWLWLLALVTCDRWQVKRDTWHVTSDTWHLIFWKLIFLFCLSVRLSAYVERFSVSCIRDIFLANITKGHRDKMLGYFFKSVLRRLCVPSCVKEGNIPVTLWSNMKVNQKVCSPYFFWQIWPWDIETRLVGIVLNPSYKGSESLQGFHCLICLFPCGHVNPQVYSHIYWKIFALNIICIYKGLTSIKKWVPPPWRKWSNWLWFFGTFLVHSKCRSWKICFMGFI